MSKKYFLIVFFLLFIFQGCRPGWITRVPESDRKYLYFTGMSAGYYSLPEGEKAAIENAVGRIVQYFGIRSQRTYQEVRTEFTTRILDELKYRGQATIRKSMLKELYFEKVKPPDGLETYDVYVLIRYPREELQRELALRKKQFLEAMTLADRNLSQGQSFQREGKFASALEAYLEGLTALASISSVPPDEPTLENKRAWLEDQLKSGAIHLLDDLSLSASGGNNQKGALNQGLPEPFRIQATAQMVPLAAEFLKGNGDLSARKFSTDEQGRAEVQVRQITSLAERNVVRIKLDWGSFAHLTDGLTEVVDEFLAEFKKRAEDKFVDFEFSSEILPRNVSLYLEVFEVVLGQPSSRKILTNRLAELLTLQGFTLLDEVTDADYKIFGESQVRLADRTPWVTSCYASARIRGINPATGQVVAVCNLEEIVGFGQNEEEASIRAVEKLADQIAGSFVEQFCSTVSAK